MRRTRFARLRCVATFTLALATLAGKGSAQEKGAEKPGPRIPIEADKLLGIWDGAPRLTPERAAGLAEGVKPIVLTWDAAYRLALARADRRTPAESLAILRNPAELTGDEFDKLLTALNSRKKAEEVEEFRDPTPSLLGAIRMRHTLDCAFHYRVGLEQAQLISNFWRPQTDLGALRKDRLLLEMTSARRDWVANETAYRNALDDLKVDLGLPLETPLVVDRSALDGFSRVFDGVDRWGRRPGHTLDELGPIVERLPREPDLLIDGKSFVQEWLMGKDAGIIEAAAKTVHDKRSTLRIRKQLRNFLAASVRFEIGKNDLGVATKDVDRRARTLLSPPPEGADAGKIEADFSENLLSLMKSFADRQAARERLVNSWVEAQILRHDMELALGSLPKTRGEFLNRMETWVGD